MSGDGKECHDRQGAEVATCAKDGEAGHTATCKNHAGSEKKPSKKDRGDRQVAGHQSVIVKRHPAPRHGDLGAKGGNGQRRQPDSQRPTAILADEPTPQAKGRDLRQGTKGQSKGEAKPDGGLRGGEALESEIGKHGNPFWKAFPCLLDRNGRSGKPARRTVFGGFSRGAGGNSQGLRKAKRRSMSPRNGGKVALFRGFRGRGCAGRARRAGRLPAN